VILMNVNDFMAKHGITDADLDRMAAPYEDGSFEPEPDGKVFSGSHLDAVGTNSFGRCKLRTEISFSVQNR